MTISKKIIAIKNLIKSKLVLKQTKKRRAQSTKIFLPNYYQHFITLKKHFLLACPCSFKAPYCIPQKKVFMWYHNHKVILNLPHMYSPNPNSLYLYLKLNFVKISKTLNGNFMNACKSLNLLLFLQSLVPRACKQCSNPRQEQ